MYVAGTYTFSGFGMQQQHNHHRYDSKYCDWKTPFGGSQYGKHDLWGNPSQYPNNELKTGQNEVKIPTAPQASPLMREFSASC